MLDKLLNKILGWTSDKTELEGIKEKVVGSRAGDICIQGINTFDKLPLAVICLDFKGCVVYANKALEELIGFKSKELIGKKFAKLGVFNKEDYAKALKGFNLGKVWKRKSSPTHIITRKDGSKRIVETNTATSAIGKNKVIIAILKDVTEKQFLERKITENEEKYRTIFDESPEVIVIIDKKGNLLDVNKRSYDVLGYTPKELIGKNLMQLPLLTRDSKIKAVKNLAQRFLGKEIPPYDLVFISKKGEKVIGSITARTVKSGGKTVDLVMISIVTEQREETEKKLSESEEKYKFLVDHSKSANFIISKTGKILFASKNALETFGYSEKGVVGKSITKFLTKESIKTALHSLAQELKGKPQPSTEFAIKTKKGEIKYLELAEGSAPVREKGKLVGIMVSGFDITERKKAEEKIKESEEKFRLLFREAEEGIALFDTKGVVVDINPKALEIVGFKKDEVIGKNFARVLPSLKIDAETLGRIISMFKARFTGKPVGTLEFSFINRKGERVIIVANAAVIKKDDKPTGIVVTINNITERKAAEQKIYESEEKFRLLFENSAEGIIMITPRGKVIDANTAMLELVGCKYEDLVGKHLVTLLPKFNIDMKKSLQTIKNFVKTESISIQEWNFTNLKGERVTVLPSTSLIKKEGKTVSLAVSLKDVTESKKAQEKMEEAMQKLKELDVQKNAFVSTAAHELKTPLTSIQGFAEMLKDNSLAPEKRGEALNIIESEAGRLTKLINDMLGLSRIDLGTIKITPVKTNVKTMVQQVVKQEFAEAKKKGLKIESKIEKGVPKINTDREKLFQILLNLVSNAVNYTKKGKVIIHVERKDDDVLFSISDTGIGIAKEHQDRLFTRFFKADAVYSREVGGTGLGLSICREFAGLLNGKIWFKSKKGRGSTFFLQLPVDLKKKSD
jgi:PAS domain S-box-containing protein